MIDYLLIKKFLAGYIKSQNLKVGDKLPPEYIITDKLNISRLTLREAFRVYREEGLIYTVQGIGTFIAADFDKITGTLDLNLSITKMISIAGFKPGVKFFERDLVKADKDVSNHLNVPEGLDILVCKRVRTADENPVIYSIDYFAPAITSLFLSVVDESVSIYNYIEENYDLKIGNSLAEIIPINCDSELAKKLNYYEGSPLLKLKQVIYDQKKSKLIYGIEYFRPDYFKLAINRRRI